jgi:hypothetical protein
MEEGEFREAYEAIRELPCAFEKALLSRQCGCSKVQRFHIGDREGVRCSAWTAQQNCLTALGLLRQGARFALHARALPGPLPHARELKVQVGGLRGLQALSEPAGADPEVTDVHGLLAALQASFGALERIPLDTVVRTIAAFEVRRRRGHRPPDPSTP